MPLAQHFIVIEKEFREQRCFFISKCVLDSIIIGALNEHLTSDLYC